MSDRKRLRYVNPDDPSSVSLPPTGNPTPSTVAPGDVFEVDADAAEIMDGDDRFEPVGDDEPIAARVDYPDRVGELRTWLGERGVKIAEGAKLADLIDLAEAYVLRNPQPTGAPDNVEESPESPALVEAPDPGPDSSPNGEAATTEENAK